MMAYGVSGSSAMRDIYVRFAGPEQRPASAKTVGSHRAFSGDRCHWGCLYPGLAAWPVGFVFAGVPGAGVLAILVMVLGIVQLPAALVSIPVIIYLWVGGDASTTSNIIFSVYLLVAGLGDNVLKPLLLGRGVDVPMPIVLFGALGGMVSAGIIGLFIGAIVAIGWLPDLYGLGR